MAAKVACGTPVVSLPGGSVPEIVRDGLSGYVCRSIAEMTKRVKNIQISPRALRQYVEENFSLERMVAQYASLYEEARCQVDSRKIA
jgi:glycosyltransferase involved in cell wall biosynthesis